MKIVTKSTTAIVAVVLLFLVTITPTLAWDDCPKGKINDPYPGDCARYVDTDGNGICDHSEPAPEDRVENIESSSESKTENTQNIEAETSSAEKDSSLSKSLLAVGIVIVNLAGILIFTKYKNSKFS